MELGEGSEMKTGMTWTMKDGIEFLMVIYTDNGF